MGKFEETFDEPVYFSDGSYVISGEYSAEDAASIFSDYMGEEIKPDMLGKDYVRFGFPPEYVEDREELGSCWFTGARKGKGSKAVWCCEA
jgi:hypothetical protein